MTQIVSVLEPGWVAQVSDRLVSLQRGIKLTDYDKKFNKCVIFLGSDGLCSIGFTGNAYIDGMPTDTWIAKQLAIGFPDDIWSDQKRPGLTNRSWPGRRGIYPAGWLTVGHAVETLGNELRRRSTMPFLPSLSIVGWQWSSRKSGDSMAFSKRRRFVSTIHNGQVNREPKSLLIQPFSMLGMLPYRGEELARQLGNELRQLDEFKAYAVVDCIRKLAKDPALGIGSDYLSILIPQPFTDPSVIVHYFPGSTDSVSYSGWVVAPSAVVAPQEIFGEGTVLEVNELLSIKYEGVPSKVNGWGVRSIVRKPQPGGRR